MESSIWDDELIKEELKRFQRIDIRLHPSGWGLTESEYEAALEFNEIYAGVDQ